MIRPAFLLFLLFVLLTSFQQGTTTPLPKYDYVAFSPGEKLVFNLSFNSIFSAGEATFEIKKDLREIAGQDHYHIFVEGKSYRVLDVFYKVRDYYESFINTQTLLPTVFLRDVHEGNYAKKEHYIFNHATDKVLSNGKTYDVEDGMHDIISAFYYLRCIDFSNAQPGTFVGINSFFEEEKFPLGVKYLGKEVVETTLGKIECYKFRPKLIEGRIFQEQSGMALYVSADKNQIPVRIESKVYLGKIKADLKSYSGLKFPFTALQSKKHKQ